MVTPIWLNGAGCATAVPAVSVKAINSVTNTFVFTDASLLISSCLAMRERYQPAVKMSRVFGCKKGEDDGVEGSPTVQSASGRCWLASAGTANQRNGRVGRE